MVTPDGTEELTFGFNEILLLRPNDSNSGKFGIGSGSRSTNSLDRLLEMGTETIQRDPILAAAQEPLIEEWWSHRSSCRDSQ
jgi:hypothetical protein